jgi:hypothetical protein
MPTTPSSNILKNKKMAGIIQKTNPGLAPYYGFVVNNYRGSYKRAKHTNYVSPKPEPTKVLKD